MCKSFHSSSIVWFVERVLFAYVSLWLDNHKRHTAALGLYLFAYSLAIASVGRSLADISARPEHAFNVNPLFSGHCEQIALLSSSSVVANDDDTIETNDPNVFPINDFSDIDWITFLPIFATLDDDLNDRAATDVFLR